MPGLTEPNFVKRPFLAAQRPNFAHQQRTYHYRARAGHHVRFVGHSGKSPLGAQNGITDVPDGEPARQLRAIAGHSVARERNLKAVIPSSMAHPNLAF